MAAGDSARFEWGALRALAPHLWPANDIAIRMRVVARACPPHRREARDRVCADSLQVHGRLVLRRAKSARDVAPGSHRRLWRAAHRGHRVLGAARCRVRPGWPARHSHGGSANLPPSAQPVSELSPRAANGRLVARYRARHDRHRHASNVHAVQHRADAHRDLVGVRHSLGVLQRLVRGRYVHLRRRLHLVHAARDGMALEIPPADERDGPRSQHTRNRQPAEL